MTVVYVSQAERELTDGDLLELLRGANERNVVGRVTGMLVYAEGCFMQQLEGSSAAVGPIFDSIKRDPRHHDLRLLAYRSVTFRRYPRWSMGFYHPQPEDITAEGYLPLPVVPRLNRDLVTTAHVAERLLLRYAERYSRLPAGCDLTGPPQTAQQSMRAPRSAELGAH